MKIVVVFSLGLILIQNAFAHHVVDIITTNNKIIITKDFNEVVDGDKVVEYKDSNRKINFLNKEKVGEHSMPKVGDKLKIYRSTIKYANNRNKSIKSIGRELIGTATVVLPDVGGESRLVTEFSGNKRTKMNRVIKDFSSDEISSIKKNAIVAVPDNGIVINNYDSVSF